jgi:predicted aconitase with swiveling domain
VSRQGVNTLASFQKGALADKKTIVCSDQNNPDLYNKTLSGVAVCLPKTIGSTTGGMVLQTVAARGAGPAALLFSERIDSLAAGGVILAKVWNGATVVTVDGLGDEFLRFVEDGMTVSIRADGTVTAG